MTFPTFQRLALLASTPISQTWRVSVGDSIAVLREDRPGARQLGLNRAAEPGVIQAAAAAGIGPALLAADPEQGRLLTQWLPGQPWQAADLRQPIQLQQVALLLRRLHATPLATPQLDLVEAVERYACAVGETGWQLVATARKNLQNCQPSPASAWRFCHNDLTPGNFIAGPTGTLHLIDWEYAGLCDPAFDLAGFAAGADLNPDQSRCLLTSYHGRPPEPAELARHLAWQVFCRSLAALWQGVIGTPPLP